MMSNKVNDDFEVVAFLWLHITLTIGVFVTALIFLLIFVSSEDANIVAGICLGCTLLFLFIIPCVIICKQRLVVRGNTIVFFSAFKKPYRFDVNEITKVVHRANNVYGSYMYHNMKIYISRKRISIDTFAEGYFDMQAYIYDRVDPMEIYSNNEDLLKKIIERRLVRD